jgi:SH3-like domain-containing protein
MPIAVLVAVAAASLLVSCNRDPKPPRLELPVERVAEPPPDPALRYVTALTTLRSDPSEPQRASAKGKAPASKVPPSTAIALLHRGERVTWLETRDDWSRVRASDGAVGWMKGALLTPVSEAQEGTVLVVAWIFDRPDLLAANAKKRLDPGTLLFVRKTKDLFTEVDAGGGSNVWLLSDRVTTAPDDVAAAKLVEKARFLQKGDRLDEARQILALLRSRSPDSPLVPVLAVELGELPPDGALPGGPSGPVGASGPEGAPIGDPPRPP